MRNTVSSARGPTIGEITSPLRIARQPSSMISTWRSTGSSATDASSAALIAPTLVPQTIVGLSPRSASTGNSTESAPISYAPRTPPPGRTTATRPPRALLLASLGATQQDFPDGAPRAMALSMKFRADSRPPGRVARATALGGRNRAGSAAGPAGSLRDMVLLTQPPRTAAAV
jgi:hypothetical protein